MKDDSDGAQYDAGRAASHISTGVQEEDNLRRFLHVIPGLAAYTALSAIVVAAYLTLAQIQNGEFGFPLDDAWIHQVYARGLGTRSEFAFFPGEPSSGSTSPLWALLLAAGYALRVDYRVWTMGLSVLLFAISAALCARIARSLGASAVAAAWFVPLFAVLEWHLSWAAASGMEIPLFICLSLALVALYQSSQTFWIGIVAGLLTLTRPEGAALAMLVAIGLVTGALRPRAQMDGGTSEHLTDESARQVGARGQVRKGIITALTFLSGFVLLVFPYFGFNLWSSGALLPNTFYAKSQEYAELLAQTDFFSRWLALYRQPFLGAQILFVPGLLWIGWRLARARRWDRMIPLAWIAMLPALYAARLPVDYQFGRYEMPIIPFIGIYGILGTEELLARIPTRLVKRAWGLAIVVLVVVFVWLGANQYARSVAVINCEMVATARWTAANLPAGSVIAAHDIGAQGYFDSHAMLDLAGLVSPEVIPFIREESRLRDWMRARGASYAIFFPTWYPQLAGDGGFVPVHSGNCSVTHSEGEVDLVVYKIAR